MILKIFVRLGDLTISLCTLGLTAGATLTVPAKPNSRITRAVEICQARVFAPIFLFNRHLGYGKWSSMAAPPTHCNAIHHPLCACANLAFPDPALL